MGIINEAIDRGHAPTTLEALQTPGAQLKDVLVDHATHYQKLLQLKKHDKQQV